MEAKQSEKRPKENRLALLGFLRLLSFVGRKQTLHLHQKRATRIAQSDCCVLWDENQHKQGEIWEIPFLGPKNGILGGSRLEPQGLYHFGRNAYILISPKNCLCKAVFTCSRFGSENENLQCNFDLWQINSPEFKYVILWVVQKAMCLRRPFSQKVSSSDAILDTLHISTFLALRGTEKPRVFTEFVLFFYTFGPLHQKCLGFSQDFPSSNATVPTFFHIFAPLHQESLVFQRLFPTNMHTPWCHRNL